MQENPFKANCHASVYYLWNSISYHGAAERPEPPQEEQSEEEEQRQQGDQENGAIELEGRHKHTTLEHYDKCSVHRHSRFAGWT